MFAFYLHLKIMLTGNQLQAKLILIDFAITVCLWETQPYIYMDSSMRCSTRERGYLVRRSPWSSEGASGINEQVHVHVIKAIAFFCYFWCQIIILTPLEHLAYRMSIYFKGFYFRIREVGLMPSSVKLRKQFVFTGSTSDFYLSLSTTSEEK